MASAECAGGEGGTCLHFLRDTALAPSSNIAAVVDISRRFLVDVSFGDSRTWLNLWMYRKAAWLFYQ